MRFRNRCTIRPLVILLGLLLASLNAPGATSEFKILLDLDNNPATGCTVNTADGPFPGVEQILTTRVEITLTGASVTQVTRQVCNMGSFGAPILVDNSGWPVGFDQGPAGTDVIETYVVLPDLTLDDSVRLGFLSSDLQGGADALISDGGPIILRPPGPIPSLSVWGLLALASLLGGAGYLVLRRRGMRAGTALLVVLMTGTVVIGLGKAAIVLDGNVGDWAGISPLAHDPAADAPRNTDLVQVFATHQAAAFFFRLDVYLNRDPVAQNDSYTVAEGGTLNMPAPGVLGNDTDADGDPLTAVPGTGPAHGTLTLNADGSFTYTHDGGETTADSFTYTLSDGYTTTGPATASITVTPVNDPPVAQPDAYSTNESVPLTVAAPGVLANDTDAEGSPLTAALGSGPANGILTLNPDGSFLYTPTDGYSGTDSFTYHANDGTANSPDATVTLTVNPVNVAPSFTKGPDPTVAEDAGAQTLAGWATGISPGPPGESWQILTFMVTANSNPALFIAGPAVSPAGTLTFTSTPDASGTADITLTLQDNGGTANGGADTSPPQTFTITVTPVNDAPAVNPATFAIPENSPDGTAVGTATYTDPDTGQTHTFAITAGNTGGAFAINAASGGITVANTAALDFETNPVFSLTVQVTDDGTPSLSGTATVTVNLTDVNEAPAVNPATFGIAENSPNGAVVGTVTYADPDAGQTHLFAITAGNTGGAFAIDPSTGQLTVAASALLDFETTPVFTLTVQVTDNGVPALSGNAAVTVNVADVNEAPVVNPATFALDENSPAGTAVGTVTYTDPDAGQTHGFAITGGNTGGAFAIDPATGQITVAASAAVDFETTPVFSLTVQVTDNGVPNLSGTATVTVNLNDVNEAPTVNPATFAVAENSPNLTVVGTVTFTDPDAGQSHTFSINSGNTGGTFGIDPTTGQILVTNPAILDFETNPVFTLVIAVTDNGTPVLTGVATVTINLTDVNEAPLVLSANFSLDENSPNGTVLGVMTFTDVDAGQTHVFAITAGNTGGAFAIDPVTGQVTVAASAMLDFETTPAFTLIVQVTDNGVPALSGTATVPVSLNDLNEPPVVNPATFALDENSPNGTVAGTVTFTDPETGQGHTFAITAGNTGGAFAIDPVTGQVTVAVSAALDFETTPTFNLTVQVTDDGTPNQSGTATVTVNLNDLNEAPTVNPATFAIDENSPNGTAVGTVTYTDPDAGQTHAFAITAGNTGGAFAIDPATGAITVAASAALDFETTPAFSLTVQVTDNGTPALSGTATVTVNLNDANEAPAVNPATFALAENSPNGTVAGTVTYTDPDAGQTHTFAITGGNTGGAFAIDPTTGQITVANSAALDFETSPVFSLTVQVTDNGAPNLSGSASVTVNLTDVNEAPTANPATFALAENSADGTVVGTATFTDPDAGQTHTFAITGGNTGGAFAISPVTGQIVVAASGVLDFEVNPTFSLTVQVTDNGAPILSGAATVTVNLTDVNEAPMVNPATFAAAENSPNGTTVGTVTFTDPDAGQTHTFAITGGNTGGAFAIDPVTGQITVANPAALDFETSPVFSLTVQVTDDGAPNLSGSATVTVNLTNANETPVVNPATFSLAENSPDGTMVGTVTYSDPDGGQTHTFAITAGNTGGAFAIDPSTGAITVAASTAIDFETSPVFGLTVQVTDNGAPVLSGTATITVNLSDINEAPAVDPATFAIDENSVNGTAVGTVTYTDPDAGQTHTFAITAGNTGGAFAIDPSTGAITVAASAVLDFETTPAFSLTVQVTDNGAPVLSGSATVTVNLNNVNEAPTVNPATFAINENSANGTAVGTVTATDPDTGQTLTFAITAGNTGGAFAIVPATGLITVANSAVLDFETTPVFSLNVQVTDNGAPNLSDSDTVTVNLININESPVVTGEAYDTIGNTLLEVAGVSAQPAPRIFVSGNLLSNDTDPDGPLPLTASLVSSTAGSVVTVNADGTFTYLPPPGLAGSDTFTYRVTDAGGASSTGIVTVTLVNRVWYVRNNSAAGGLGRSTDPFDTLAEAQTASSAGDTIYVYSGTGTTLNQSLGIVLKANQRLLGEGVQLDVPVSVNGGPNPTVLRLSGSQPLIDNTAAGGNGVSASNISGVEIRGLNIAGNANAIDVTTSGGGGGGAIIANNTIRASGVEGVDVNAGGTGTLTLDVHDNTITATGNGFDARTTAGVLQLVFSTNTGIISGATGVLIDGSGGGTLTIAGFADNTVHQNTIGTGMAITSARFDASPAANFQTVTGGTTTIGVTGNGVGAAGLVMNTVSGDLSFTDLDIVADAGTGLRAGGTGAYTGAAGFQITVGAGVATIAATGGAAVDAANATLNLPFSQITSTASATTGVNLDTVGGTFSAPSGSTITNAAGTDFNINAGTATVTYDGTITDATGRLVSVTSATGGTKTFNGAIGDSGGGSGTGILLNGNTGATINFIGTLTLTTGANDAFTATGGGTVTANNPANTVTTTTGRAIVVQNTTIGATGLLFRSVSAGTAASGPASGIVLANTGASGNLAVTGAGAAGTGGTIQHTTSHGISLTNTLNPTFVWMRINNTAGSGVKGTQVTNFTFTNGVIDTSGTGLAVDDSNIAFNDQAVGTENNLSGAVTITGNTLTNAQYHGVDIYNFAGTIDNALISSNTITSNTAVASSEGSGIRLIGFGTVSSVASITRATIDNNVITNFPAGAGIQVQGGNADAAGASGTYGVPGSGTDVIAITNNRIAGATAVNRMGTNAIITVVNGRGQGNFNIANNGTVANPLTNIGGTVIGVSSFGSATVTATVANNVIVANNAVGSQGIGAGVDNTFALTDVPSLTLTATGNTISRTDGNGILAVARNSNGILQAKIQNNTVAAPLAGVRPGIRVDSGSASGNTSVCLNISGNTSAGSGGANGIGLRKQGTLPATNAFGVNGMAATSSPGVETYINGLNPAGGGTLLISATSGFTNCSLP